MWLVTTTCVLLACMQGILAGMETDSESICIHPYHEVDVEDGELFSQFWPLGTPMDYDCVFLVRAPFRCFIDLLLEFMDMSATYTGANQECGSAPQYFDTLRVRDYYPYNYYTLTSLCGKRARDNRWNRRGYFINAFINVNAVYSRWHFTWQVRKEGEDNCDAHFTGDYGTVVSPGYPGIYYNNMDSDMNCPQYISVDNGDIVELIFVFVDLRSTGEGEDTGCADDNDWIMVFDYKKAHRSHILAVLCDNDIPPPLYSESGPHLTIDLISNEIQGAYGYKAHWRHLYKPVGLEVVKFGDHGDMISIEAILVNQVGKKVPNLGVIVDAQDPDWYFAAKATNLDACDVTFSVLGEYNDTEGTITFVFKHLPPGHYEIDYMASSYSVGYYFHDTYDFNYYSRELMAMRDDCSLRATAVDFMIYEMYDGCTKKELEQLRMDLKGGFQLYMKKVYVSYVLLERDYYTGYIKASVWVKGPSLLTQLRALCNVISSPYPFKTCHMDGIKPIKHSRTLTVFDQEYGYETCNPCATAIFQHKFKNGCHCPCHCAGKVEVHYSGEMGGNMDITEALY